MHTSKKNTSFEGLKIKFFSLLLQSFIINVNNENDIDSNWRQVGGLGFFREPPPWSNCVVIEM